MRAGRAERSRLAVMRLQLTNFRSYASGAIAVSGAPVVLAGPNGAGKTNVLDAISLLSPGRGLRGAKLAEHTRKGPVSSEETLWAVAATVARGETDYEIGTGLTQASASRQVRLNGVAAGSSADLGDIVQLIWLTPAMDRLFIESAGGRRRFLDRLVLGFDAGHARAAAQIWSPRSVLAGWAGKRNGGGRHADRAGSRLHGGKSFPCSSRTWRGRRLSRSRVEPD
jgi:DNA replication and repair protein RecF